MSISPFNCASTFDCQHTSSGNVYTNDYFRALVLAKKLPKVPIPIEVWGNVSFDGHTGLPPLPTNLTIKGSLNLNDCIDLESLPENLTVERSLNLNGCKKLIKLPKGLVVKGNLYLHGCVHLKISPDDRKGIAGHIYEPIIKEEADSDSDSDNDKALEDVLKSLKQLKKTDKASFMDWM